MRNGAREGEEEIIYLGPQKAYTWNMLHLINKRESAYLVHLRIITIERNCTEGDLGEGYEERDRKGGRGLTNNPLSTALTVEWALGEVKRGSAVDE